MCYHLSMNSTKHKGDIGLTAVIADLTKHGYFIALPMHEHLSYDIIVLDEEHKPSRVQVKYKASKNGVIPCSLENSWANTSGIYTTHFDNTIVDGVAIYCPDTEECYYLNSMSIAKSGVYLRIAEPLSGQKKGIRWAKDHKDPSALMERWQSGNASAC